MPTDWTCLETALATHSGNADIGICVRTGPGEQWGRSDVQVFPSASTAKIPIMVALYRAVDAGELSLQERWTLEDTARAGGSGVLRHLTAGASLTLADLLYLMIAISDNTATNVIIERVGMSTVNQVMHSLGMSDSVLGRLMVGRLAAPGEQENLATARDYIRVMSAIEAGTAASVRSCHAMMDLLALQQDPRRLGRYVPREHGYRWGSKNGTNEGLVNEVGYVQGPHGTLLLAVFCQGVPDEVTGANIIASLARAAMMTTGMLAQRR